MRRAMTIFQDLRYSVRMLARSSGDPVTALRAE
jgi:hypothetical protein